MKDTGASWENVSDWYGKAVGREGHYYHQHVILPQSLELLGLREGSSLLDLGCGQGVLARTVPKHVSYAGVDASPGLIRQAKSLDKDKSHHYVVADVTKPLPIPSRDFTHAALILALQNIRNPRAALNNAHHHLGEDGRLLIVINHPCFRIPRQSSWQIDESKKTQYRRVDRYLTTLDIPIAIHPGKGRESETARSYHRPLSDYSRMLFETGFLIERIEEWISDKVSAGAAAGMENRARKDFPLFMAILAIKTRRTGNDRPENR